MVVIRLSRGGAHKRPFYHIVAADSRFSRDGGFIERLGFFNPMAAEQEEGVRITKDRVDFWIDKGAQVSPRVKKLLSSYKDKTKLS